MPTIPRVLETERFDLTEQGEQLQATVKQLQRELEGARIQISSQRHLTRYERSYVVMWLHEIYDQMCSEGAGRGKKAPYSESLEKVRELWRFLDPVGEEPEE